MIPPLSNRLLACCGFVRPGDRVADIGCDHGYLGIHLLQKGIAASVIASDVNEGPLLSAQHNARKFSVSDRMSFYLSNGVQRIPRDFDTMVCAGMGADTMIGILSAAPWLQAPRYRLVLQCQSRRPALRRWLWENGFSIAEETLAQDGKFIYPIMLVTYAPGAAFTPAQCYLSPALLRSGSPLLPAFYGRLRDGLRKTVEGLAIGGNEDGRMGEYTSVLEELQGMEDAIYGNGS